MDREYTPLSITNAPKSEQTYTIINLHVCVNTIQEMEMNAQMDMEWTHPLNHHP